MKDYISLGWAILDAMCPGILSKEEVESVEDRVFYQVDPETLKDMQIIAFEDIKKEMLVRFYDGGKVQTYKDCTIVKVTRDCDTETFCCEAFK